MNAVEQILAWIGRALSALWRGAQWGVLRWWETLQRQQTWKGKTLVGCGGLLVLVLLYSFGAAILGRGSATPTPTVQAVAKVEASTTPKPKDTATQAPKPTGTPKSTDTPAPTNTPEPTATHKLTVVGLGETAETDKWAVTISEVKRASSLLLHGRRLEPDGQWLIVYGEVRNLTTEDVSIFSSDFALTTPSLKGEIRPHGDATGAVGLQADVESTVAGFLGLSVKAGQSAPLVIAFDVPRVVEEATLQVVEAEMGISLGDVRQMAMLPTAVPTSTVTPRPPTNTPGPTNTPIPPIPSPSPFPVGPATAFGDGTYIVGSDIAPGRYRARNLGPFCYWERLSGLGGGFDEIIANGNPSGSSTVVDIHPTDKGFSSSGCGQWTTDLSPVTSNATAPFSDGTYIVGVDIAPGTWRSSGGSSCYWERASSFSGELGDIIANGVPSGQAIVTIASTDTGFSTSGCGEWNLQP